MQVDHKILPLLKHQPDTLRIGFHSGFRRFCTACVLAFSSLEPFTPRGIVLRRVHYSYVGTDSGMTRPKASL